jgi:hypothetical protein
MDPLKGTALSQLRIGEMHQRNVSPPERLARQICKKLEEARDSSLADLREQLINLPKSYVRALRIRGNPVPNNQDFENALMLAISNGWLRVEGPKASLTEAGATMAKRTRVGGRRYRLADIA